MDGKSTRIEDVYPSWTYVLPLLIKGFIFPPIARLLLHAYERTKRIKYLQHSIQYSFATLAATHIDHPRRPYYQHRLAGVLLDRFTVTRSKMDLRLAQLLQESVIPLVGPGHEHFSWHRNGLGRAYRARYDMSGKLEDLDLIINLRRSNIDLFPQDSEDRVRWLTDLSRLLHNRYWTYGHRQDADAQFEAADAALKCVVDKDRSFTYRTMAWAYTSRYSHTGDRQDLDLSLKWGLASIGAEDSRKLSRASGYSRVEASNWAHEARNDEKTSPINGGISTGHLSQLSQLYEFAYDATGDVEVLELAVRYGETAVRFTSEGADEDSPWIYANYANVLTSRYQRFRNRKDLDLATKYINLSIEITHPGDMEIHRRRQILVLLLLKHYGLQKDFNTIKTALEIQESIVEAMSPTLGLASKMFKTLSHLHMTFYDAGGPRHHRNEALRWIRAAVDASPPNDTGRLDCIDQLIQCYLDRYTRLSDPNDLEEAIKAGDELRPLISPDRLDHAYYFATLAQVYADRWALYRKPEDHDTAIQRYRQICDLQNCPSGLLWETMRQWVAFVGGKDKFEAFHVGYRIIPELFWLGNDMKSRHETLIRYELDKFTAEAILHCMRYDALQTAIEFLEQSLALTLQQLLDLRIDLGELKERYPGHALELERVSMDLLDIAGSSSVEIDAESIDRSGWDRQRKLAHERSTLLKTIRELPGFEQFLKPLAFEELKTVADHGPVIVINLVEYRCDAIVIFPGGKLVRVPLPDTGRQDVASQRNQLQLALGRFGIQARGQHIVADEEEHADDGSLRDSRAVRRNDPNIAINSVLAWTFSMFVAPIYKVLAENGITSGRIWWCPTGPVSSLPLHAAGPPTAYVPSYTPTLGALLRARNRAVVSTPANITIQAIGITETMNATLNKLPKVGIEISVVTQAAGAGRTTVLMDNEATLARVSELLPRATWLHLACHGQQGDISEPLKSGLLLYDNSKLELEKIIKTDIPDASFAFLSACETAMGDVLMSGESLHIAGGMVFAGFKAVIGTLWAIRDDDGPVVAKTVYEHVFGEGKEPDVYKTAEALHLAVQGLRASGVPPHRWVPFIHIGV